MKTWWFLVLPALGVLTACAAPKPSADSETLEVPDACLTAVSSDWFAANAGETLWIPNTEVSSLRSILETSPETVRYFFDEDGILVVCGEGTESAERLDELLQLPVTAVSGAPEADDEDGTAGAESGVRIASIYYQAAGAFVTHELHSGRETAVDRSAWIEEVVAAARERQELPEPAPQADGGFRIGENNYTYVQGPKGRLDIQYQIATVQDDNFSDRYVIAATVTGSPGCALGESYDQKYQGETLSAEIRTSGSGVRVEDAGLVGTLPDEGMEVMSSRTTSAARWEAAICGSAQEEAATLCTSVRFQGLSGLPGITVQVAATYVLDSWDAARETVSLNETLFCHPERAICTSFTQEAEFPPACP